MEKKKKRVAVPSYRSTVNLPGHQAAKGYSQPRKRWDSITPEARERRAIESLAK